MKSINTALLRSDAQAYADCIEYCGNMLTRMDSAHLEMDEHWQGGARQGYNETYEGVVKPSINALIAGCNTCRDNLIEYARICDERDDADRTAFGM